MKNFNGETFEEVYGKIESSYDQRWNPRRSPLAVKGAVFLHWLNDYVEFHYARNGRGVNETNLYSLQVELRRHLWVTDDLYYVLDVDAPTLAGKVIRFVEAVELGNHPRFKGAARRDFYRTLSKLLREFQDAKGKASSLACELNGYLDRVVFFPDLSRSTSYHVLPESPHLAEIVELRDALFNGWDAKLLSACLSAVDGFMANPDYKLYFAEGGSVVALLPSAEELKDLEEFRSKLEVEALWLLHTKTV